MFTGGVGSELGRVKSATLDYAKMKPQRIFFDTNAFRYVGIAFESVLLAQELQDKILISPLSAFEVFAQLSDEDAPKAEAVLKQIHAIRNWTNPKHAVLLPWPDDMIQSLWSQKVVQDEDFRKRMEGSFHVILSTDSLAPLKEAALQQKQMMEEFKLNMAQDFKNMVDDLKAQQGKTDKKKAKPVDTTAVWFHGVAKRAKADPTSKTMSEVQSLFGAYHEFEQEKLRRALVSPNYNPLSHANQNDIIDAEQLVYLGDHSLCMVTSDKGLKSKVTKSDQATRIILASPQDLMHPQKAEGVIKTILT